MNSAEFLRKLGQRAREKSEALLARLAGASGTEEVPVDVPTVPAPVEEFANWNNWNDWTDWQTEIEGVESPYAWVRLAEEARASGQRDANTAAWLNEIARYADSSRRWKGRDVPGLLHSGHVLRKLATKTKAHGVRSPLTADGEWTAELVGRVIEVSHMPLRFFEEYGVSIWRVLTFSSRGGLPQEDLDELFSEYELDEAEITVESWYADDPAWDEPEEAPFDSDPRTQWEEISRTEPTGLFKHLRALHAETDDWSEVARLANSRVCRWPGVGPPWSEPTLLWLLRALEEHEGKELDDAMSEIEPGCPHCGGLGYIYGGEECGACGGSGGR